MREFGQSMLLTLEAYFKETSARTVAEARQAIKDPDGP